ncbi:hypothetical protein PENTCL1PPCAC_20106, partial [Pristionchus entomophagus]
REESWTRGNKGRTHSNPREDQQFRESCQVNRVADTLLIPADELLARQQHRSRASPQAQSSPSNRSDSPVCISHRSSVSIDSGCGVSITSATNTSESGLSPDGSTTPMPYATFRKISMEGSRRPPLPDLPKSWTPRAASQEPRRTAEPAARTQEPAQRPEPALRSQSLVRRPESEPSRYPEPATRIQEVAPLQKPEARSQSQNREPEPIPVPIMRNRDRSIAERARMFENGAPIVDGCLSYRPPRPPRGDTARRASLHEELEAQMREKRNDSFRIVASTIESTTSMRAPSMRRIGRMERPRSMFEEREEKRTSGGSILSQNDAYRNSTLERSFTREPVLVDSMSFSQITPPPVHRKFGVAQSTALPTQLSMTVNKTPPSAGGTTISPPKGSGLTVRGSPSSPPLPKPRSASSSSHVVPLRTPIKAEITPPRNVQRASAHMMISGVFTATKISDASRTPPTKTRMSRPLSLHEVRVGCTPDEEITGIFHARQARVLSRQSSSSSSSISSNSPPGCRKNGVVGQPPRFMAVNQMRRSGSSNAGICSSRGKLEKMWRESEGL